jgi:hypothetical protein|tara:strand:- start:1245 stop:1682 length:438 start_codon:yes stop_codon:yes gene_type:complete
MKEIEKSVAGQCGECQRQFRIIAAPKGICPYCDAAVFDMRDESPVFEACAACGCETFFRQKDFNHAVGCCVILIAAIFVPWTYGLSLIPAAIVDWVLFKRTPDVGVCYKCRGEYRGWPIPATIHDYDHYAAERFQDEWKSENEPD